MKFNFESPDPYQSTMADARIEGYMDRIFTRIESITGPQILDDITRCVMEIWYTMYGIYRIVANPVVKIIFICYVMWFIMHLPFNDVKLQHDLPLVTLDALLFAIVIVLVDIVIKAAFGIPPHVD